MREQSLETRAKVTFSSTDGIGRPTTAEQNPTTDALVTVQYIIRQVTKQPAAVSVVTTSIESDDVSEVRVPLTSPVSPKPTKLGNVKPLPRSNSNPKQYQIECTNLHMSILNGVMMYLLQCL